MPQAINVWDVWTCEEKYTPTETETKVFVGREVSEGMVVLLRFLAVTNKTVYNKYMDWGFRRAETDFWAYAYPVRQTGGNVLTGGGFYLVAGEAPIAKVVGAEAGNELHFFARGIIVSGGPT